MAENDSMSGKKITKPRAAQKRSASVAVSTSLKDRYAAIILERLAAGETLRAICRTEGFPVPQSVLQWQDSDADFASQYARARRSGLDVMAEEIVDISDDKSREPNCRRVAVDSRKWLMSKLRPDKYGDRVQQEISGPGGGPVQSKHEIVFVKPEGK